MMKRFTQSIVTLTTSLLIVGSVLPLNVAFADGVMSPPLYGLDSVIGSVGHGTDGVCNIGRSGVNPSICGFQFVPPANAYVCSVNFSLAKQGSPTSTVKVRLYAPPTTFDGFGIDYGSLMATSTTTIIAGDLTTSQSWTNFKFQNCIALAGGSRYTFLVHKTDGTTSSTDYYNITQTTRSSLASASWTGVNGFSSSPYNFRRFSDFDGENSTYIVGNAKVYGISSVSDAEFVTGSGRTIWNIDSAKATCSGWFPVASILDVGNGVAYGLCVTLGAIFVPSTESIEGVATQFNNLLTRFPFDWATSIFTVGTSLLTDEYIASASAGSNTLSIDIPFTMGLGSNLTNIATGSFVFIPSSLSFGDVASGGSAMTIVSIARGIMVAFLWWGFMWTVYRLIIKFF